MRNRMNRLASFGDVILDLSRHLVVFSEKMRAFKGAQVANTTAETDAGISGTVGKEMEAHRLGVDYQSGARGGRGNWKFYDTFRFG